MNEITTVHVVFKTHLDIGFTDLASNVLKKYKENFIPKALELAEQMSSPEDKYGFVWTTGSWLIQEYLSDATEDEKLRMERAIHSGHIAWHGLPFTTHTEMMDASLFKHGLSIASRLDQKYGKKTISAKMTDVPGHTRSIVPHMAAQGIQYLHLGVNPASKVPSVPSMFVWKNADGSELIVNYADNYGNTAQVEGLDEVLHFAHTGDNNGPPSIKAIHEEFDRLRKLFPGAKVIASTMDAFAEKLISVKHKLPVLTEEIGDSWIHGTAADPMKMTKFREMQRIRVRWLEEGRLIEGTNECNSFSDNLLLVPEHTWGMDEKKFLGDYTNYDRNSFDKAREKGFVGQDAVPSKYQYIGAFAMDPEDDMSKAQFNGFVNGGQRSYQALESSWQEQRNYLEQAINALSEDKQQEIREALLQLEPTEDVLKNGRAVTPYTIYSLGQFQISFSHNGSISSLVDGKGKVWADERHPLGKFLYESSGVEDYDKWFQQYVENTSVTYSWSDADFGKPGMENVQQKPRNETFEPQLLSLHAEYGADFDRVLIKLEMPGDANERLGAPRQIQITYEFSKHEPTVNVVLDWFNKPKNRLPEAIWFSFSPMTDNSHLWTMDKLGQPVSPLEVVKNGNRNLHAVGNGLEYKGAEAVASIQTLDASVVAPGERRLLQFDNTFASLDEGFHFLLCNNVWGTNFPMWFGEDSRFRFKLVLRSH